MDNLDEDESKDLEAKEIMKDVDLFLQSQVSYNGRVFDDPMLRKKVFIQDKEEDAS